MIGSFQRTLDHLRSIADSEAHKGRLFERLMKRCFLVRDGKADSGRPVPLHDGSAVDLQAEAHRQSLAVARSPQAEEDQEYVEAISVWNAGETRRDRGGDGK